MTNNNQSITNNFSAATSLAVEIVLATVACAVSAQNEMNFGFAPLRTADTTALFLASSFERPAVASHPLQLH
jgi:hypothetical protein